MKHGEIPEKRFCQDTQRHLLEHVRGFKAIRLWSLKIYELSDTRIHLANKLVSILVPQRRNVGGKFFIKFVVAVVV
ncbi:hypothetical protein ACLKA7_012414 [Drosophila subpalustris]